MLQLGCPSAGIFDHRMLRMGDITLVSGCRIQSHCHGRPLCPGGKASAGWHSGPSDPRRAGCRGPAPVVGSGSPTNRGIGGTVTLDLLPGLGHGIDDRALQLAIRHLA